MKNNIFTPYFCSILLCYAVIIPTAVVHAQDNVEGSVSAVCGSYLVDGVGEVSVPEIGDRFHRVEANVFQSGKTIAVGGFVRDFSRANGHVTSFGLGARLNAKPSDDVLIKIMLAPVLQHRGGRSAIGGAVSIEASYAPCSELTAMAFGSIEVGKRGLLADLGIGLVLGNKVEARLGMSNVVSGEYLSLDYLIANNVSIGAVYAWDSSLNELLANEGIDAKRRGFGGKIAVKF